MRFLMSTVLMTALTLGTSAALAGQPAYVGTWGKNAAQCKNGQDTSDAPMLITRQGYDSHEAHCTFSSIKKSGSTWAMQTKCSVQGDQQVGKMTLSVSGKTLTVDGTWKLKRC